MKISMIGTGYVGLTTGTCLAELGHTVTCVDNNKEKIDSLNKGIIPIFEPGLEEMVKSNVEKKNLFFTTDLKKATQNSQVVFITVGTPSKPSGEADLTFVENVAKEIAQSITDYTVVVEKSTVPVETGEKVAKTIESLGVKKDQFDVVSNPEFLREGNAIKDFLEPDRIVIGTNSEKAKKIMQELYKPIKTKFVFTDIRTAEIIKHSSNSFLATKISFINAVSQICELTGADVTKVAYGIGLDKRIGEAFLNAGAGYGGFCFPKDVEAFIKISQNKGYDFKLLKEVQVINKNQILHIYKKIENQLKDVAGKTIAVLGLAFKPNTDDLRESPSLKLISLLQNNNAKVKAFDPQAIENAKKVLSKVELFEDIYECIKEADAAVILTEWEEVKKIEWQKAKGLMKNPIVIDGRNIFDPESMKKAGFSYDSIGR